MNNSMTTQRDNRISFVYWDIDVSFMTSLDLHLCSFLKDINDNLAITFDFHFSFSFLRFAIASRDIVVGEVLTVEKAIVSHMLPEYMVIIFIILILIISIIVLKVMTIAIIAEGVN